MENTRHDNDMERLSEYLDNRLSAQEAAAFKHQLEADLNLRTSYETILATRLLLQRSPRRRAPHNFTLSEKTAGEIHRRVVILPFLRFSSAFSAAISIIIFAVTFLSNNPAISPSMMMAAAPAAEKSTSSESTSLPPIIVWGNPVSGMGGGYGGGGAEGSGLGRGGGAPQTMSVQGPQILGGGAPPATTEGSTPAPTSEALALPVPQVQSTPEPTSPAELVNPQPRAADNQRITATEMPLANTLPAITGSGPILGIRPTEVNRSIQNQAPVTSYPNNTSRGIWLIAGSILLFIGALGGITAIYLARK
jgi:hypothetical protein